jgi:hypothetical protein
MKIKVKFKINVLDTARPEIEVTTIYSIYSLTKEEITLKIRTFNFTDRYDWNPENIPENKKQKIIEFLGSCVGEIVSEMKNKFLMSIINGKESKYKEIKEEDINVLKETKEYKLLTNLFLN